MFCNESQFCCIQIGCETMFPSSVLAPSSDARSPVRSVRSLLVVRTCSFPDSEELYHRLIHDGHAPSAGSGACASPRGAAEARRPTAL